MLAPSAISRQQRLLLRGNESVHEDEDGNEDAHAHADEYGDEHAHANDDGRGNESVV